MTLADSSANHTAKRLPDPALSSRAFALFFIVMILIAIMLLVAPKTGAANRNWQGTSTDSNTGTNWSGDQIPGPGRYGPHKSIETAVGHSQNVTEPPDLNRSESSPYYYE